MPVPERWTASMVGAWQYAVSGVEAGLTATAAYADFLAGGGHIRTADWYYLARVAGEAKASGDLVQGLPFETPIPSQAYTKVDIDYGQKYVAVADLRYTDMATGEIVRRTVTLYRDELGPWHDIEDDIEEIGAAYGVVGGAAGVEILRTRFWSPKWLPP